MKVEGHRHREKEKEEEDDEGGERFGERHEDNFCVSETRSLAPVWFIFLLIFCLLCLFPFS